jgi:hypothetical protein
MSVKSAQGYRAEACHVRRLAKKIREPKERQTLLDIAERYERLAQYADTLATQQADLRSH